jgi:hypothetical protein
MNGNLRIIYDNAADRGSSQSGALVVENLRNDKKVFAWRSAGTTESLNLTWAEPEPIGGVAMAFNNFTSAARVRVRGWVNPGDVVPNFDTDYVQCQPEPILKYLSTLNPIGDNAYTRAGVSLAAFGLGGYGAVWVPGYHSVRRLQIDVMDPTNPDGYLEFSRLVVGRYWTPIHNFDYGNGVTFVDSGKSQRAESGDMRSEQGPKWRKIGFGLSYLDPIDRANLTRIYWTHGRTRPVFVSAYPEHEDVNLEQVHQLWGLFVDNPRINNVRYNDTFASAIEVEEM